MSALSFILGTTPPGVTFDTVSFTDTGVQGDHITDNGQVTLSGTVSDNVTVSQVQVFNGSQLLGTATVDNVHHTWTLTTTLAPGAYNQLNATAIDEAGNPANATTTQTVQVNDAPVLAPISPTLTAITEDQTTNVTNPGQTVSSFIGASISDAGTVKGIAITGLTSTNGIWQYSIDGGTTWTAIGAVSDSTALLLDASDKIRFLPDGNNGGTDTISYRAWDETAGTHGTTADTSANGGTTAFSTATDTAHLAVTSVNDAPVLAPISPTLTAITEDQTANVTDPGQTVSSFIGASISDVDAGAVKGIAITGLTSTSGTWQYSIDGGTTWTAIGAVSNSTALLLDASDKIRFLPDDNNGGTDTMTYRAWDETAGTHGTTADTSANGGTTAFSTATDTAHLAVTSVNDAPVATITPASYSATEQVSLTSRAACR